MGVVLRRTSSLQVGSPPCSRLAASSASSSRRDWLSAKPATSGGSGSGSGSGSSSSWGCDPGLGTVSGSCAGPSGCICPARALLLRQTGEPRRAQPALSDGAQVAATLGARSRRAVACDTEQLVA